MSRFKAPPPEVGEKYDDHMRRVIQAIEDWINARFPEGEPK